MSEPRRLDLLGIIIVPLTGCLFTAGVLLIIRGIFYHIMRYLCCVGLFTWFGGILLGICIITSVLYFNLGNIQSRERVRIIAIFTTGISTGMIGIRTFTNVSKYTSIWMNRPESYGPLGSTFQGVLIFAVGSSVLGVIFLLIGVILLVFTLIKRRKIHLVETI